MDFTSVLSDFMYVFLQYKKVGLNKGSIVVSL